MIMFHTLNAPGRMTAHMESSRPRLLMSKMCIRDRIYAEATKEAKAHSFANLNGKLGISV